MFTYPQLLFLFSETKKCRLQYSHSQNSVHSRHRPGESGSCTKYMEYAKPGESWLTYSTDSVWRNRDKFFKGLNSFIKILFWFGNEKMPFIFNTNMENNFDDTEMN